MRVEVTLAEIESSLRKAARACGLPWGLAEEAGKAARWLAAFDLPGPELTLEHLHNLRGPDYQRFVPDCDAEPWKAPGGILCPIVTGAALADRASELLAGRQFELAGTASSSEARSASAAPVTIGHSMPPGAFQGWASQSGTNRW